MTMYEQRCTRCGETKLLSDFYFNRQRNKHETICKACRIAYQKERHIKVMNDQNLHFRRLVVQSNYRKRYRYKIAEKSRLERRKMGISPQQYIDKEKLLKLYQEGYPVDVIARKCGCSFYTVKLYAHRNGIRRGHKKTRICYNCKEFPCFNGIENMESNFALTCNKFKVNYKRKKQTNNNN